MPLRLVKVGTLREVNENEVTRIFRGGVAPEASGVLPHQRDLRAGERFHTPCVLLPSGTWALVLLWSLYGNVPTVSPRLLVDVCRVVWWGALYSFGPRAQFLKFGLTDGNGVRARSLKYA